MVCLPAGHPGYWNRREVLLSMQQLAGLRWGWWTGWSTVSSGGKRRAARLCPPVQDQDITWLFWRALVVFDSFSASAQSLYVHATSILLFVSSDVLNASQCTLVSNAGAGSKQRSYRSRFLWVHLARDSDWNSIQFGRLSNQPVDSSAIQK